VNKKFWDGLPPDIRATLEKCMAEATVYADDIAKSENEAALEAVRKSGRTEIITLTPVLYAVAEAGDAVAGSIVDRMADEVATMAVALLTRLDLTRAAVPVVLGGGALQNAPERLLHRVREKLAESAPRADVVVLDAPPVVGPLTDALMLAGAPEEAVEAARARLPERPAVG